MRKLIAFHRALAMFLSDTAGHVTSAWSTVKGAIHPMTLTDNAALRDAVVVIDNMVEAVAFYCRAESKEPTKESAQTELPEEGKGG
jgi:hypothetical protein